MRVLLFTINLIFLLPAYAAGPDQCILKNFHPDPVADANRAGRDNLLDSLKSTPKKRLRSELPDFLQSTRKNVRAFNKTTLHAKDPRFRVLTSSIYGCYIFQLKQVLGQEGNLQDLLTTEKGRQFARATEDYIAQLEANPVSEQEKRACYYEDNPDKHDECWGKVAYRVLETVHLPGALRAVLALSKSDMTARLGYTRVSQLELLLSNESRAQIAVYQDIERQKSASDEMPNFRHADK